MSAPRPDDHAARRSPDGRAVVIQTAHLGDVVLTIPLLVRLAERHGPVDLVTTPRAAPLVETHPSVRRVMPFDKHGDDRGMRGLGRLGRALRAESYARAYLPHGSLRSAAVALLAGVPERVGFAGAPGSLLYTRRADRPTRGHMSGRLAALAGAVAPVQAPWFAVTEEDRMRADAWLRERRVGSSFVALAPGSRWGTKRWPYYPELAEALGGSVVVLGGSEDAELGASIVASASGQVADGTGKLGLRETAAVIARAALLVTNDSVALHLATALARPLVAIFGPTVTDFGFGPLGPDDRVVERPGLACRPCSPHGPMTCPLGHHRCMREVEVARVLAAVRAQLSSTGIS